MIKRHIPWLFAISLILAMPIVAQPTSSPVWRSCEVAQSGAKAPSSALIGTYYYYDARDHGYAFHVQLEADGTAYYIAQAEDGNSVRKGTWHLVSEGVELELDDEQILLQRDDYGNLIERRSAGDRFFFNIRQTDQP